MKSDEHSHFDAGESQMPNLTPLHALSSMSAQPTWNNGVDGSQKQIDKGVRQLHSPSGVGKEGGRGNPDSRKRYCAS